MATLAAIKRRVSGSSSRPSKRCCSQSGTDAPQRSANLSNCGKRVIGRMPGTMLTPMPARCAAIAKAQEQVGLEEELRDGAIARRRRSCA